MSATDAESPAPKEVKFSEEAASTTDLDEHVRVHDSWYNNSGFFARLKRDWPEPPEQLHSGGWAITRDMADYVEDFTNNPTPTAFDLCCGEGATAIYLAQERGWNVTGLDVNEQAITKANDEKEKQCFKLREGRTPGSVTFIRQSAFYMDDVPSDTFDVVYGQDPDALDSPFRIHVFNHVFRMLKPGGVFTFHHHWIPGFGWTPHQLELYWSREATRNLSADHYVNDLISAGFQIVAKDDISRLAESHLKGCFARNQERIRKEGPTAKDEWLERTIGDIVNGKKYGIRVVAQKPVAKKEESQT